MLAKKGRRTITVNDVEYHYKVMKSEDPKKVVIQNTVTDKKDVINTTEESITPSLVESFIHNGKI